MIAWLHLKWIIKLSAEVGCLLIGLWCGFHQQYDAGTFFLVFALYGREQE